MICVAADKLTWNRCNLETERARWADENFERVTRHPVLSSTRSFPRFRTNLGHWLFQLSSCTFIVLFHCFTFRIFFNISFSAVPESSKKFMNSCLTQSSNRAMIRLNCSSFFMCKSSGNIDNISLAYLIYYRKYPTILTHTYMMRKNISLIKFFAIWNIINSNHTTAHLIRPPAATFIWFSMCHFNQLIFFLKMKILLTVEVIRLLVKSTVKHPGNKSRETR